MLFIASCCGAIIHIQFFLIIFLVLDIWQFDFFCFFTTDDEWIDFDRMPVFRTVSINYILIDSEAKDR